MGFRQVSVETCIKAIGEAGDPELSAALHERYTDFEPVHALIEEWEPHHTRNAGMRRAVPPIIYKDHRGNRLPSVTTIIGRFKESGGLLYWANQQGLEGKTLDQARAEVTTPGTLAHKAVEDHINGRPETALSGRG